MNDPELLHELARAGRRHDREVAELEAAAPVDPSAVDRAVARALRELETVSSGIVARRRRRARAATWGAVIAIAAAVVVVVRRETPAPPLPAYEVALLAGGARTERALPEGAGSGSPLPIPIAPGAELDLVARPATRVGQAVDGRAFLLHDGRATPWSAALETTAEGTVHVRGALGRDLPLGEGAWAVGIVVGPGSLPRDLSVVARAAEGSPGSAGPGGTWRVVRIGLVAAPR